MKQEVRIGQRTGTLAVPAKANGPVAAAVLAAGVGVSTIGLMTTLGETIAGVGNALNWYKPVGALSGKTGVGIIVWLLAWVVLASAYRGKDVEIGKITRWTWILIGLGLLLTFPPFFDLFTH